MPQAIVVALIVAIGGIVGAGIGAIGRVAAAAVAKQAPNQSTEKAGRTWVLAGIVGGGLAGLLVGALVLQPIGKAIKRLNAPELPLEVVFHHDFENSQDSTNIAPWTIIPDGKPHTAIISTDESHSGRASLRLSRRGLLDPRIF